MGCCVASPVTVETQLEYIKRCRHNLKKFPDISAEKKKLNCDFLFDVLCERVGNADLKMHVEDDNIHIRCDKGRLLEAYSNTFGGTLNMVVYPEINHNLTNTQKDGWVWIVPIDTDIIMFRLRTIDRKSSVRHYCKIDFQNNKYLINQSSKESCSE